MSTREKVGIKGPQDSESDTEHEPLSWKEVPSPIYLDFAVLGDTSQLPPYPLYHHTIDFIDWRGRTSHAILAQLPRLVSVYPGRVSASASPCCITSASAEHVAKGPSEVQQLLGFFFTCHVYKFQL